MTTYFNTEAKDMMDCPVCKGKTVNFNRSWKLRCPYCDGTGWVWTEGAKPVPFGAGIWRDDVYQGEATA